jgi:exopolyphosphatase/guanosine-5'-triphosphate,3'-diphosphate pyrophosphatase
MYAKAAANQIFFLQELLPFTRRQGVADIRTRKYTVFSSTTIRDWEPEMENVLPRWEWRSFGGSFPAAEERLKGLVPDRLRESAEIYILSAVSNDNVKIRHGLMDIKTLQQVNEDGLELWQPDMKASFPLRKEEILRAFKALRVAPLPFRRDAYTPEQFIGELMNASRHLRTIDVRKQRTGYLINGCIAEFARLTVEGLRIQTVALEAEDPVQVAATVRQLGLERLTNTSYPRGLKNLVQMSI